MMVTTLNFSSEKKKIQIIPNHIDYTLNPHLILA